MESDDGESGLSFSSTLMVVGERRKNNVNSSTQFGPNHDAGNGSDAPGRLTIQGRFRFQSPLDNDSCYRFTCPCWTLEIAFSFFSNRRVVNSNDVVTGEQSRRHPVWGNVNSPLVVVGEHLEAFTVAMQIEMESTLPKNIPPVKDSSDIQLLADYINHR